MSEKPYDHSHVSWHVELSVRPGKLNELMELTREMVASTLAESGVLHFERFLSEDGTKVHIYERYIDSESAVAHLNTFRAQFSDRFIELVERDQFVVFGSPSVELAGILRKFGAKFFKKFDGFSKIA